MFTYATLVNPDRTYDWIPDPDAPVEEVMERILACTSLFDPMQCPTAYTSLDYVRSHADAAMGLLAIDTTEQSILTAVEEGADHHPLAHLVMVGLLGTPRGCAIVEERVDDLWGLYGERRQQFIKDQNQNPRFLETDRGLAANRTLNMISSAIDTSINASKIGGCPNLRAFCRARIEERASRYLSSCPQYLAWVFPNERLPVIKGPPFWPDPPYWTPAE